MKPSLPDSPVKPALLSVLGCLVASIDFFVPWPGRHSSLFGASLFLGFAVFAAGAILSLKFTSDLRHGVENQDWPESQIEPLRKHLESPWYTALSIALLVAFVLFAIFIKRFRGESWACYLFVQTVSQLRMAVRRPLSRTPSGPLTGLHSLTPIHSDHWGQR